MCNFPWEIDFQTSANYIGLHWDGGMDAVTAFWLLVVPGAVYATASGSLQLTMSVRKYLKIRNRTLLAWVAQCRTRIFLWIKHLATYLKGYNSNEKAHFFVSWKRLLGHATGVPGHMAVRYYQYSMITFSYTKYFVHSYTVDVVFTLS